MRAHRTDHDLHVDPIMVVVNIYVELDPCIVVQIQPGKHVLIIDYADRAAPHPAKLKT